MLNEHTIQYMKCCFCPFKPKCTKQVTSDSLVETIKKELNIKKGTKK